MGKLESAVIEFVSELPDSHQRKGDKRYGYWRTYMNLSENVGMWAETAWGVNTVGPLVQWAQRQELPLETTQRQGRIYMRVPVPE